MRCSHCGEALPFIPCPECGGETPEKSRYCCECGKPIEVKQEEIREVDFSQRILCVDGNCIGVINEKGVCNVCGKPYAGERGKKPV